MTLGRLNEPLSALNALIGTLVVIASMAYWLADGYSMASESKRGVEELRTEVREVQREIERDRLNNAAELSEIKVQLARGIAILEELKERQNREENRRRSR